MATAPAADDWLRTYGVDGGANRAVIELRAATLGIARDRLAIARADRSRAKQARIADRAIEARELRARLVAALSGKA